MQQSESPPGNFADQYMRSRAVERLQGNESVGRAVGSDYRPGNRLVPAEELGARPIPEFQVKGFLVVGSFVLFYGPPEHYKSFLAYSLCAATASGTSWNSATISSAFLKYWCSV